MTKQMLSITAACLFTSSFLLACDTENIEILPESSEDNEFAASSEEDARSLEIEARAAVNLVPNGGF